MTECKLFYSQCWLLWSVLPSGCICTFPFEDQELLKGGITWLQFTQHQAHQSIDAQSGLILWINMSSPYTPVNDVGCLYILWRGIGISSIWVISCWSSGIKQIRGVLLSKYLILIVDCKERLDDCLINNWRWDDLTVSPSDNACCTQTTSRFQEGNQSACGECNESNYKLWLLNCNASNQKGPLKTCRQRWNWNNEP